VPNSKTLAFGIAETLALHSGGDVVVLDMAEASGWTDYFVVATSTSSVHLHGLARFVGEHCAQEGVKPLNKPDSAQDQTWVLIDLGDVIVHLMSADSRAFYDLEKLWFKAQATRVESPGPVVPDKP